MPVTDLAVSLTPTEEIDLLKKGFIKIDVNLNKGAGGKEIYLWYKDGSSGQAITRIQFSFNEAMEKGLLDAGYIKINKDLNAGAGGYYIYLWYFKGTTEVDVAIAQLHVSTTGTDEGQRVKDGWEMLTCDLNKGAGGNWIYLWVKRDTPVYIREVKAMIGTGSDGELFKEGYTRMDDNTNKDVKDYQVFIWYLLTTDKQKAIRDLKISQTPDEGSQYRKQGFTIVAVDLNKGTGRNEVFLWYKMEGNNPIKTIGFSNDKDAEWFRNAGATVIQCTTFSTAHLYFFR